MNPSTSSMDVYKVSEDGGSFRLPCLNELPGKWIIEVKAFSTIYPEMDYGKMREAGGGEHIVEDRARYVFKNERPIFRDSCYLVRDRLDVIVAKDSII